MITAPEGANVLNSQFSSDDIGRYFTLPISGRYVFQLSLPWAGCATDTVEIIYERESFTLDSRSAYTCKTGDTPVFYFRAKNGMPPYTYELYENGAFVQSNSTGDFTYGSPNNSYSVRISDACGKNFTTEIQVLDLTFDQIVSGSSKVCVGDTIHLSCLSLGAKAFLWEGPNGTIVSTEQNPAIPNATLNDSGVYTLTLQPGGCSDPVIQRIAVEVYVPPALLSYPDTIDLCLNGDNTIPDANPLPNHTVVWFESDGVAECSKPAVSTATIHDEIFYVGQKNDTLGCVGDLQKVTIKVNRAPIPDFIVAADKACYQESAVLTLNNLNTSYIYDIYSDEALQNKLTSITNQASSIIDLNNFLEQTTAYYITVTDNLGCISEPLEQEVEVITLQITPDKLPPYRTNQDYSQQLSSNAVLPTFLLTTGELPIGLQLNALGLISGKVPTNKISSKWTFTVQVEDENGCRAEKLYTLNGDFFIPKVFTPNGDGVNDIFMSGYRVVIFDRLGITIYEGDSGWDGTYKGKEAVPDIYFYKLYYETGEGESKVTTGYIGLER